MHVLSERSIRYYGNSGSDNGMTETKMTLLFSSGICKLSLLPVRYVT